VAGVTSYKAITRKYLMPDQFVLLMVPYFYQYNILTIGEGKGKNR
jgi:stage V sporulation protein SpoVS